MIVLDPDSGIALAWARVPRGAPRRDSAWSVVRELAGAEVRLVNPCPRCGGPHGPVRVVGGAALVSIAYSGDLALAALAPAGAGAIGLDAEPGPADAPAHVGALAPGVATVRDWVRVEAVLKADGRGLAADPASVRVMGDAGARRARVDDAAARYTVVDLEGPDGHVVSAAIAVPD